jgi:hypothetical protein
MDKTRVGGVAQVTEHLLCKHDAPKQKNKVICNKILRNTKK